MDEYLKSLHPVTAVLQLKVLSILKEYDIKTLLDVGGVGKLAKLSHYDVSEANLASGVDGCDLPFENDSFDATVSVATVEHVEDPVRFLQECYRVAKKASVHWFPCGDYAQEVEDLKEKYGHWHPCQIPPKEFLRIDWTWMKINFKNESFTNCGEHLLLCMTLTPSLKTKEVYDYIIENYNKPYGAILIGEK